MAKLYFRYGAMNCGKTTALLQVAHNYEEKGKNIILIKPQIDTKGSNKVVSRIGISKEVDYLLKDDDSILNLHVDNIDCILVDEAQFLSEIQIDELFYITKEKDIPVICYGLKVDSKSHLFKGSQRLIELSDDLDELATICSCGKKARFNARKINDIYVYDGPKVIIDGSDSKVSYEPLCGKCYLEKVEILNPNKILIKKY